MKVSSILFPPPAKLSIKTSILSGVRLQNILKITIPSAYFLPQMTRRYCCGNSGRPLFALHLQFLPLPQLQLFSGLSGHNLKKSLTILLIHIPYIYKENFDEKTFETVSNIINQLNGFQSLCCKLEGKSSCRR